MELHYQYSTYHLLIFPLNAIWQRNSTHDCMIIDYLYEFVVQSHDR